MFVRNSAILDAVHGRSVERDVSGGGPLEIAWLERGRGGKDDCGATTDAGAGAGAGAGTGLFWLDGWLEREDEGGGSLDRLVLERWRIDRPLLTGADDMLTKRPCRLLDQPMQ